MQVLAEGGKDFNPLDGFIGKNEKSDAASRLNSSFINDFSFSLYKQHSKSGTAV